MKIGELFVALGFDVDDTKLKEFNDGISKTVGMLGKITAGAAAAVFGTSVLTENLTRSSVALRNFAAETGDATDDVQRFYNVAGRLNPNVSLESTIGAFTRLRDVIAEAKLGKGPLGEAAMLGISNLGELNPVQVIETLRENFKNNTAAWGRGDERVVVQLMQALGLGPEFVQAIKATDAEYSRLWNNPILSEEYINRINTAADAQKEFRMQWDLLKSDLTAEFAPGLVEFFTNLTTVMRSVPDLFRKVRAEFNALETPIKLITVALTGAAAAVVALAAPFGPIILGVGMLLAALNDLGRFLRGEKSLIGTGVDAATNLFGKLKETINGELAKTPEQHRQDRERLLRETSPGGGTTIGPQSSITNYWNVSTNGDSMETAQLVNDMQQRQYRSNQIDLQFQASGMQA